MSSSGLPSAITSSRKQTYCYYTLSTFLALVLTISTPNTRLWNRNAMSTSAYQQDGETVNWEALVEVRRDVEELRWKGEMGAGPAIVFMQKVST